MKMSFRILVTFWIYAAPVSLALAGIDKSDPLEHFTHTGKTESCLATRWIQDVQILDDQNMLFRTDGQKYYLNHLPYTCPQLSTYKSFMYELRGLNELCNTDIITVLTDITTPQGLLHGASCGLGKFERLETKGGK